MSQVSKSAPRVHCGPVDNRVAPWARSRWRSHSLRQFSQCRSDERRGLRILAESGGALSDRDRSLRAGVAEADEREHRVLRRLRQSSTRFRRRRPGRRNPPRPAAGALSLSSRTSRAASLGPTPGARAIIALSCLAIAAESASAVSAPRMPSATFAPTPCTLCSRRNQSRSDGGEKSVKPDRVLAHLRFDQQLHGLADRRQRSQRLR